MNLYWGTNLIWKKNGTFNCSSRSKLRNITQTKTHSSVSYSSITIPSREKPCSQNHTIISRQIIASCKFSERREKKNLASNQEQ